jgi:prepilin-type N-terminal cleavage/methylation domain-containing protein
MRTLHYMRSGYTLVEVLAASALIAVGAGAAATLTATMGMQEIYSERASIARNYQENLAMLWQLGLTPNQVMAVMPTKAGNRPLADAIFGEPTVIPGDVLDMGDAALGLVMETAQVSLSINAGEGGAGEVEGGGLVLRVCRPSIR